MANRTLSVYGSAEIINAFKSRYPKRGEANMRLLRFMREDNAGANPDSSFVAPSMFAPEVESKESKPVDPDMVANLDSMLKLVG